METMLNAGKPAPEAAPEPQGEPSIDFEAANFYVEHLEAGGTCNEFPPHMENLGRAYLHLAAEVEQEKLFRRADIEQRDKFRAALDSKDAECVALAAEVERLRGALQSLSHEITDLYIPEAIPENLKERLWRMKMHADDAAILATPEEFPQ